MKVACFLAVAVPLSAQVLQVSDAAASRGKASSVAIKLTAPSSSRPAALQWTVVVPSDAIEIRSEDVKIAGSAKSAGKALQCAAGPSQEKMGSIRCVLAGGLNVIGSGEVAVVNFIARNNAPGEPVSIRLKDVLGATVDAKKLSFEALPGKVEIH